MRAKTTYTVKSYAYLANNAQISLDSGSSRTFTTTTDDRPNILSLPVLLSNIDFNGVGTSSIQVINGGYSYANSEEISLPYIPSVVSTLAGVTGSPGIENGIGTAAMFNGPAEIAIDAAGNVYVGDYFNHLIRKIDTSNNVTTVAGVAGGSGSADGIGTSAMFYGPIGIAVDAAGNLYVSDYANHLIRRIEAQTNYVSTIAGVAKSPGSDNGTGAAAKFSSPAGVAVDSAGKVYVADFGNHVIRLIR